MEKRAAFSIINFLSRISIQQQQQQLVDWSTVVSVYSHSPVYRAIVRPDGEGTGRPV